jgi:hypothetical protein
VSDVVVACLLSLKSPPLVSLGPHSANLPRAQFAAYVSVSDSSTQKAVPNNDTIT